MNPLLIKILHLAAVFALFSALGATLLAGSGKKSASMLHGISLVLILLLGFAMLGKPPMDQFWWIAKIVLWLFIGAAPVLVKRKLLPAPAVFTLCLLAGTCAAYLAVFKPF